MNRLISKSFTLLALALGFATAATAATPVAVWDGDFTTATKGDWTLSENGNAKTAAGITIGEGVNGAVVTASVAKAISSIIIRYSNLTFPAANNGAILVTQAKETTGQNQDWVGVAAIGTDGKPQGNFQGKNYQNSSDTRVALDTAGVVGFYYNKGSNTSLFSREGTALRFNSTGLKSSGDTSASFYGFALGGNRNADRKTSTNNNITYASANGLKITGIAVFESELTAADVAAYRFPSEQIVLAKRTAAWNRDLANNLKKGKYVMSVAPVATVADGMVTVPFKNGGTQADNTGVTITWGDPATEPAGFTSKDMTVLVRYSGRSLGGGNSAFFAAMWGNPASEQTELVYSGKNNNTMMATKTVTPTGYNTQGTAVSSVMPEAGIMMVTMNNAGQTRLAFAPLENGVYGDFTEKLMYSGMRSANQTFYGIRIAGTVASFSHYYRAGMKVESVAIIDGAYTAANFPQSAIESVFADGIVYGEDYDATISGSTDFSAITTWDPELTALTGVDYLKVSNTAPATLTFDTSVSGCRLTLVNEATDPVSLVATQVPTFGAYDFSGALGGVTVGFATGAGAISLAPQTTFTALPDTDLAIPAEGKVTLAPPAAATYAGILSGAGAVDIAGPVTLSKANTFTGALTVKPGATLTMNNASCLNNDNTAIVEAGGVLNLNGKVDGYNKFELRGGSLVNKGADMGTNSRQNESITLTADSEIGGTGNFGLVKNAHNETTLALDTYTLTKNGNKTFWLVNTVATGTGCLAIRSGTVSVEQKNSNFGEATVALAGGTLNVASGKTFTLKRLAYESGALTLAGTLAGLETVSGSFDTTTSVTGAGSLQFADTVTFSNGTTRLSSAMITALSGKTVVFGDGGKLAVFLTDEQILSAEPFAVIDTAAELDEVRAKLTFYSTNCATIPGEYTKVGNTVKFSPKVDRFTREVAADAEFDWSDSAWTKNGESDQPCTPSEGYIGAITVTLLGDATLNLAGTPADLAFVRFVKGTGVESATLTISYTPTARPTSSSLNTSYSLFGFAPTLDAGITLSASLDLPSADYVSAYIPANFAFVAAKRPAMGTISLKIGARTEDLGKIKPTLENVGAVPLSGLLWTNAKLWDNNTPSDPGYTDLGYVTDANGSGKQVRYAFRGPNTYFSSSDSSTGNAVLTRTYVDDGENNADKTWTITNATNEEDMVTLPAAPNKRGWQIHLDELPYAAFDLYFITASDVTSGLKETPIKLSANGGQTWVSYTGDSVNNKTILGDGNWNGEAWQAGTLTEGLNYLKMRVSAAIMGVDKIEALEITHGLRNTNSKIRSGLCAIQIVELANDGAFTLTQSGDWTTDPIWSSGGVAGKTWESGDESYATIPATSDTTLTISENVTAKKVTVTGTHDFALYGAGTLTSEMGVDANAFAGNLILASPIVGTVTLGPDATMVYGADTDQMVVFPYTVAGTGRLRKIGTCNLAFVNSLDLPTTIDAGNVVLLGGATKSVTTDVNKDVYVTGAAETEITAPVLGTGRLYKQGTGTVMLTYVGTADTAGITVMGGTVKAGSASIFNNTTSTLVITNTGVFDVYGKAFKRGFTLDAGGALVNSGSAIGSNTAQMNALTVNGDATVGGTGDFGLLGDSWGPTTLALGANTLTKTGANKFWICNTTIDGAGKIRVEEGTLAVSDPSGGAKTTTFADGCIDVAAGGTLQVDASRTLVVGKLKAATGATIANSGTISLAAAENVDLSTCGTLAYPNGVTVYGSVKAPTAGFGSAPVTIADGATLDLTVAAEATTVTITTGTLTLPAGATLADRITINGAAPSGSWKVLENGKLYDASRCAPTAAVTGEQTFSGLGWTVDGVAVTPDWTLVPSATLTVTPEASLDVDTGIARAITFTVTDDLALTKSMEDAVNATFAFANGKSAIIDVPEGDPMTALPLTITGGIIKTGAGTLAIANGNSGRTYTVDAGTLMFTQVNDGAAPTIIVNADGTFDMNGKRDPKYAVRLNGGWLVNNGSEIPVTSRQIASITLTADSYIGGTAGFGMVYDGYNANTINLGGYTLTKEGTNTFTLCNTTVQNGQFVVREGTLKVNSNNQKTKASAVDSLTVNADASLEIVATDTLTVGTLNCAGTLTKNGALKITDRIAYSPLLANVTLADGATVYFPAGTTRAIKNLALMREGAITITADEGARFEGTFVFPKENVTFTDAFKAAIKKSGYVKRETATEVTYLKPTVLILR